MPSIDTHLTAGDLARRIAQGDLTAIEAVELHIERVEQTDANLNAVVVRRFDEARREAEEADEARRRGELRGPLHGVPITVKEIIDLEGAPTTAGITARAEHRAERDAPAVARLRAAGAIVIGKTNAPHAGVMGETDNPLYGRTNNPWNADRSPGGSSGGDAAIIAAGGVPLGLASDAGGSIRHPGNSCGVCGLKPTGGRLPTRGHWLHEVWPAGWLQMGPMARCVDDLSLAMRVLCSQPDEEGDLATPPVAWRGDEKVSIEGRRIGFYHERFDIPICAAVRRAIDTAADRLRAAGAIVEPFAPPEGENPWSLYLGIFYADGLRAMKRQTKGSPIDWRIRFLYRFTSAPAFARRILAPMFDAIGQRKTAATIRSARRPVLSAPEYLALLERQNRYRRAFLEAMDAQRIDAILSPAGAAPALPHGEHYAYYSLAYAAIFNLLGMPAGVVPVTRVREDEEGLFPATKDHVDQALARADENSAGLPISVQVAARPWRDDIALAVMREIERRSRRESDFPTTPVVIRE